MSQKPSRQHHYLSQCYLKGFTRGRSKKSRLTVIDLLNRQSFETIPRNVGGVRDFNRIEAGGLKPDKLEKALSAFESRVASAIKITEQSCSFEGEAKELIINLIALMAVRSPEIREHHRKFHAEIAEYTLDLALSSKERWEEIARNIKKDGKFVKLRTSYEEMKDFHNRKEYRIDIAREWHIHLEFVGVKAILPYLFGRNWSLVKRTPDCGPFITCDRPVQLYWKNPESVPACFRSSPGFGMKDTIIYFPLSQDIVLVGEFDNESTVVEVGEQFVGKLNAIAMHMAYRHVYAPKLNFPVLGEHGNLLTEGTVLDALRNGRIT